MCDHNGRKTLAYPIGEDPRKLKIQAESRECLAGGKGHEGGGGFSLQQKGWPCGNIGEPIRERGGTLDE